MLILDVTVTCVYIFIVRTFVLYKERIPALKFIPDQLQLSTLSQSSQRGWLHAMYFTTACCRPWIRICVICLTFPYHENLSEHFLKIGSLLPPFKFHKSKIFHLSLSVVLCLIKTSLNNGLTRLAV